MNKDIKAYHTKLQAERREICDRLFDIISSFPDYSEGRLWHGHPVWFIDGNPIAGYSSQKAGIRLMFWSGADFNEDNLKPGTGKYKDASIFYTDPAEIKPEDIKRWLDLSVKIQWDYKNLVKRKGVLERLS